MTVRIYGYLTEAPEVVTVAAVVAAAGLVLVAGVIVIVVSTFTRFDLCPVSTSMFSAALTAGHRTYRRIIGCQCHQEA